MFTSALHDAPYGAHHDARHDAQPDARYDTPYASSCPPHLTARERQVLTLWLNQRSKAATARILGVSEDTVKSHIANIRHKYLSLGRPAPTKSDLLLHAVKDGFLESSTRGIPA